MCLCVVVFREDPQVAVPKTVKKMEVNFTAVASKTLIPEYSHRPTEVMFAVTCWCVVWVFFFWDFFLSGWLWFFFLLSLNLEGYLYLSRLVCFGLFLDLWSVVLKDVYPFYPLKMRTGKVLCLFLQNSFSSGTKKTELCSLLIRFLLLEMLSGVITFWRHLTDFRVAGSHATSSQLILKLRIGCRRELTLIFG